MPFPTVEVANPLNVVISCTRFTIYLFLGNTENFETSQNGMFLTSKHEELLNLEDTWGVTEDD